MRGLVVVMGVSGSGKSTVGSLVARQLGVPFCEGDDLHPAANIEKMARGVPLDDTDRAPWLARIAGWMQQHAAGGVVSCSALRRRYRDRLRQDIAPVPAFALLDPPRHVLEERLGARQGHFMPPGLLDSQLALLERPIRDEHALRLAGGDESPAELARCIVQWLAANDGPAATVIG